MRVYINTDMECNTLDRYLVLVDMRLASAAVALASLVLPTWAAGQIPVVDGVLGGVDVNAKYSNITKLASAAKASAATPGKLRYVENSGVCGAHVLSSYIALELR